MFRYGYGTDYDQTLAVFYITVLAVLALLISVYYLWLYPIFRPTAAKKETTSEQPYWDGELMKLHCHYWSKGRLVVRNFFVCPGEVSISPIYTINRISFPNARPGSLPLVQGCLTSLINGTTITTAFYQLLSEGEVLFVPYVPIDSEGVLNKQWRYSFLVKGAEKREELYRIVFVRNESNVE